jgi:hypothetical protein
LRVSALACSRAVGRGSAATAAARRGRTGPLPRERHRAKPARAMTQGLGARAAQWWARRFAPIVDEDEVRWEQARRAAGGKDAPAVPAAAAAAAAAAVAPSVTPIGSGGAAPARCAPLSCVPELMAWRPPAAREADPCVSRVPLLLPDSMGGGGGGSENNRPRLLVCHDFKGWARGAL